MAGPHPVDIHVGKRLRLRRSVLGLSQEVLGNAIGVTFQQIQKYERGVNRIGASRLYQFASYLKVPVGYFFDEFEQDELQTSTNEYGMSEPAAPSFQTEQLSSKETIELIRCYYQIPSKKLRRSIYDLARTLASEQEAS
ncbi:MAG: transcriptional regulator [Rickettsiales bacterium]|nr:transcriptional regulator [Rickettsiales bacterium]|tara:strand:+ start:704 stop:1120 length:417 start_codon:yes stop_codon:yes gene_type:complete